MIRCDNHFWRGHLLWLAVVQLVSAGAPPGLPDLARPGGRVVIVHDEQATDAFRPNAALIHKAVERGLTTLTGEPTVDRAWRQLLATNDVVGLKLFTSPGPTIGTRPEVVEALLTTLLSSGVPATNIVIWDRVLADLQHAGYDQLAARFGVELRGSVDEGWDREKFYETALLGQMAYTDLEFGQEGEGVGRRSHLTKLLTRRITKLVNVAPLLNHNQAGVSGLLYSLSLGAVDNTLRFSRDPARLAVAVPEIYAMPELSDRVVLNVVDALVCQYAGEKRSYLHYSATLNEIWFSKDPVALDVLALLQMEQRRRNAQMAIATLNRELYDNASLLELGVSEVRRIRVERVE